MRVPLLETERRTEQGFVSHRAASIPGSIAVKRFYLCVIALVFVTGGCRTADVNPPAAKAGNGYVDFYAEDTNGLCWQIRVIKKNQVQGRTLLQEFRARTNDVVRLAFLPGQYRFGISFLNRAIIESGSAEVRVEEGKITPVRVTLVETGKAMIENRGERIGASYARTGRSTKVRASEGATFRVEADPQESVPYRPISSIDRR